MNRLPVMACSATKVLAPAASWSTRQLALFHAFNPNGICAKLRAASVVASHVYYNNDTIERIATLKRFNKFVALDLLTSVEFIQRDLADAQQVAA